jgi:hypothetical protein
MDRSLSKPRLKREARRRRHQWAWVTVEGNVTVRDCRVLDVSQSGAKVVMGMPRDIVDDHSVVC